MEVKDQLVRLVRLQELIASIRAGTATVEGSPRRLEEIENRFRERNAEYVAFRERYQALEADQRERTGELGLLEEHRKKYMDDLMQVTNQREYAAMLKEIDGVKSRIGEHEEAVLSDMDELESLKGELASHEEHIQEERKRVAEESADVEQAAAEARRSIEQLQAERKRIEAELPRSLVSTVRRLEEGRQGVFLSRAEDGTCQSCYVRIRPQVFQEIRVAAEIHACGSCRRILYHPASLKETAEVAKPATARGALDTNDVGALNRGPA